MGAIRENSPETDEEFAITMVTILTLVFLVLALVPTLSRYVDAEKYTRRW